MDTFGWNRFCLTRNGQPWFPVMGELHYTRLPAEEWRTELAKLSAGGITVVSTYVFWLHHEPQEGRFCFVGQRSLRAFLAACRDEGLSVWLRLGPWCHGEAKNGGFPDWLMEKGWPLRTNDPRYLQAVRTYWARVWEEVHGFMHAQGGPVIGIQLENEYGHCGGAGDPQHMDTLLRMAQELGFCAPYYTATGWGGALLGTTGKVLPVMGAYCAAPWDASRKELPANGNYLFSEERNDVDIGSDFRCGEHLTFDPRQYPFLTAELAGGMGGTYHRRPYVSADDIGAMTLCKLGSGVSMLGYYMYHGGTNPGPGLNESRATGGHCDCPEMSYDGRTPVREYGQISENFKEIKLYAMFLKNFGETLAPLPLVLPDKQPSSAEDIQTPRYAFRMDDKRGYLFVNHYQRRRTMEPQVLQIEVPLKTGAVAFPEIRLEGGERAFYPVRMRLGDAVLVSALATPLCVLNQQTYVFYTDGDPQYRLEGNAELLTLTRNEALNAYQVNIGRDVLVVANAPVVYVEGRYRFFTRETVRYTLWEDAAHKREGVCSLPDGENAETTISRLPDEGDAACYAIRMRYAPGGEDCYLRVDYTGAKGELYLNEEKIADDFYDGHVWEIGMRRYGYPKQLQLKILPLYETEPVYFDRRPVFVNGCAQTLRSVSAETLFCLDFPG